MNNLETYLRKNCEHNVIDHALRAEVAADGTVSFYLHPNGVDGETLDYRVAANTLTPKFGVAEPNAGERFTASGGWPEGCRKLGILLGQLESEVREIRQAAYKTRSDGWYGCMIEVQCALDEIKQSCELAAALLANKKLSRCEQTERGNRKD